MRAVSWALPLAMAAACTGIFGPEEPRGIVETDRDSYRIGETGEIRITNVGTNTVTHHGLSCASLFRRVGQDWQQIGTHGSELCLVIAYPNHPIAPDETVAGAFPVDGTFEAGSAYRFVVLVQGHGKRTTWGSNTFTVIDQVPGDH